MTGHTLLTVWSDSPMLSGLIWLLVALVLLYLARRPAHAALLAAGRATHRALRLSARSIMRLETRVDRRNREVLLADAANQQERRVEREFRRVSDAVARDLAHYPALHRNLSEQVTRIDEDYRRATEVPPSPPAWLEAVDAVANIPAKDDPAVNKILEDIHATLERSCHNTVMEFRTASHRRHKLLRRMLPYWRRLRETLERVDRNIANIEERTGRIDEHMARYEALRAGADDPAGRSPRASALSRFVVSGLLLAVAGLAGFLDYSLIARPMAELTDGLGGPGPVGLAGYSLAQVAAFSMVLLQVFLGLFLMELLRVTRMFPAVGSWDERRRHVLAAAVFVLIVLGALLVAALAFQRDHLLARDTILSTYLLADPAQPPQLAVRWVPALAQMFLGLLLTFVLALVAVPLEAFVQSARTVLGSITVGLLRLSAYLLRLLGQIADGLARLLVRIYDLLIFLPLALEQLIRDGLRRGEPTSASASAEGVDPARQPAVAGSPRQRRGGSRRKEDRAAERQDAPDEDDTAAGDAEAHT